MNIICFGDSITQSGGAEGDRWPTRLQHSLDEWRPGVYKVFNRGIGGNTSAQGYDRMETEVLPALPAVVLVEFGINDAHCGAWSNKSRVGVEEFKDNLRAMHYGITGGGGKDILIVNHTITGGPAEQGNGRTYIENFTPYNEAIRELAEELSVPALDLPAMLVEKQVDLEVFLAPHDHLHLSTAGNHIYAELVFEALRNILDDV